MPAAVRYSWVVVEVPSTAPAMVAVLLASRARPSLGICRLVVEQVGFCASANQSA
jgi:hypothetical protein